MYVLQASHEEPVQSAGVELVREVPLDPLTPLPLQPLASFALNAAPIAKHRSLLRRFPIPVARPAIRLGNVKIVLPFRQVQPSHRYCDIPCPPQLL